MVRAPRMDDRDLARTTANVREALFGIAAEPTTIGRFELRGTLGEGAMGKVYAAHDPRLDRRVALKLIRAEHTEGPLAEARRQRLLREARSLARLSHPNIVEVFEIGTEGDEIYVAMEMIDGVDARRWVARDKPRPARIVRAFIEAGKGLAAAHEAGMVHRDFKPDNVLVGDDGRVKVVDFGLAVAAEDDDELASTIRSGEDRHNDRLTHPGAMPGTPRYMSPERFDGADASPSSDQFSFCVSLVEALTGEPPNAGASVRLAGVSARIERAMTRGLSPDPAGRFASMEALLRELRPRRSSRLGAALAVVSVGTLGAVLLLTRAPDPCQGGRARAAEVWDTHRTDLPRHGRAAVDRYVGALVDHHRAQCRSLQKEGSPAELDALELCFRGRLRALERVLAVFDSGEVDPIHLVDAVDRLPDPGACEAGDNPEVAADRADLARASALSRAGDAAGLALAQEIRARADARADPLVTAEADVQIARYLIMEGSYEEAQERLEAAFFSASEAGADGLLIRAATLLAHCAHMLDAPGAQEWLAHARTALARSPDPRLEAQIEHRTAVVTLDGADVGPALQRLDRAIALAEQSDPGNVGLYLRARATALQTAGRSEESEAEFLRAIEAMTGHYGPDHPETLRTRADLGTAYWQRGRLDRARELIGEALAGLQKVYGPDHYQLANELGNLGVVEGTAGNHRRSREYFARAVAILRETYGDENLRVVRAQLNLAESERVLGNLDASLSLRQRSLATLRAMFGDEHGAVGRAYNSLGLLQMEMGEYDKAIASHRRAVEIFEEGPELAAAYFGISHALSVDRTEAAIEVLHQALRVTEQTVGRQSMDYAMGLTNLAALYVNMERPLEALDPALDAVALYDALLGPYHEDVAFSLLAAATAEIAHGRYGDAERHAARAIAIREIVEIRDDVLIARAKLVYARALWPSDRRRSLSIAEEVRDVLEASGERGDPGLTELALWERDRR